MSKQWWLIVALLVAFWLLAQIEAQEAYTIEAPPAVTCGSARTCGEMTSCEQAYVCLREGNTRLDRDRDGVPCESICQ